MGSLETSESKLTLISKNINSALSGFSFNFNGKDSILGRKEGIFYSAGSKERIGNLLNEVNDLSEVEKLLFYLNLPTGVHKEAREVETLPRPEITEAANWIKSHLQPDQELCLAKHEVYDEYMRYCEKHFVKCVGREDLGKLMRTIYPSVTGRRLGTRGQTKHCYGGLTKRSDLECPSLQSIGTENATETEECEAVESGELSRKRELIIASSSLICEWAEKLLNQPFKTISDIAEHLVRKSYVNCNSVAAYTILSQLAKYKEENNLQEAQVVKPPTPVVTRPSSSNPRNAKHQLQLKLQEKERWKEQKKKLEEQRCAVTGETCKTDENNSGSADTATVSYEASMSSDNTSNQGNSKQTETKTPIVQKTILPKPVSSTGPTNSSGHTPPSTNTNPTVSQKPLSTVNPLLIVSPSPTSGQLGSMFFVSQLNANQQLLVPIQAAAATSATKQQAAVSDSNNTIISNENNINNTNGNVMDSAVTDNVNLIGTNNSECSAIISGDKHLNGSSVDSISTSTTLTATSSESEDISLNTNEQFKVLLNAISNVNNGAADMLRGSQSVGSAIDSMLTNKQGDEGPVGTNSTGMLTGTNSPSVFQRSQSLPAGLVNTAENVINKDASSDRLCGNANVVSDSNQQGTISGATGCLQNVEINLSPSSNISKSIKKEGADPKINDIPHQSIVWSIPVQTPDSDVNNSQTALALPLRTIDASTMSCLGLQTNDNSEQVHTSGLNSTNVVSGISPIQSPQTPLTPTQSVKGLITRKGQSKTVSSLLKEQRVKVESPELGGKNKYVNDNRPVAQILKELREKKKQQNLGGGRAMQKLSFAEEKIPKEIKEHSVRSLNEKIAREALVMRKVQALHTQTRREGLRSSTLKLEQNHLESPSVSSPVPTHKANRQTSNDDDSSHSNGVETTMRQKKLKSHQLALRNLLNQRMSSVKNTDEPGMSQDKKLLDARFSSDISGQKSTIGKSKMSAYSSKRENAFLKKYLATNADENETSEDKTYSKTVCASMNPTLASLLANNNNDVKSDTRKHSELVAGLLNTLNISNKSTSNRMTYSNNKQSYSDPVHGMNNLQWNETDSSTNNNLFQKNSDLELMEMAIGSGLLNGSKHQSSTSGIETTNNTAFVPIQREAEANIVSPIRPQAMVPNDSQNQLVDSDPHVSLKLKELLSATPTDSNDSTADMCTNPDWLARENSSFVPYNQNYSNQFGQTSNMVNSDCVNVCNPPDLFQQANQFEPKTTSSNYGNNSNDGFASMDGVRPPAKRGMEHDSHGYLSKRQRHLSDQTNRRSKRNVFIPPLQLQPLIPQDRTPSQESLPPMASPSSSQGYSQCPPESPFSPEVHAIMSNTNNYYCNEFSNVLDSNNYRSMSVPVQNFMQNEGVDYGLLGNGYNQGSSSVVNMQDASQLGHLQDNSQYMNMSQQPFNNISYQQDDSSTVANNNQNMMYNNARKNLMQILESRLSTTNFRDAAQQQNLRGDHMISGASVKPTLKMRHKLGETLNSVMLHHPNNNNTMGYCNTQNNRAGQYNIINIPNPTPPASHPPTPVEFSGDVGVSSGSEKYDQNQQSYNITQNMVNVVGAAGMGQVPMDTPTSLDNIGSQESRESIGDPLFNMCDEGENGGDMTDNSQFDFLRIL